MRKSIKVLFVCLGNICRSPTAHGVFQHMIEQEGLSRLVEVDSAGTHAYHIQEPPDRRAQQAAMKRGIDLSPLRARRAFANDFDAFDYVLAMDRENLSSLEQICPEGLEYKLGLFLDYAPDLNISEVPDPYYGGPAGFDRVLDLIEEASHGLISHLQKEYKL